MQNGKQNMAIRNMTVESIFAMWSLTGSPSEKMTLEIPITHNILKIFEPTTFPMAISRSPFKVAATDVATSGKDVGKSCLQPVVLFFSFVAL